MKKLVTVEIQFVHWTLNARHIPKLREKKKVNCEWRDKKRFKKADMRIIGIPEG